MSPYVGVGSFGSIVFAQIRYLVVNLNKKNQKSSVSEIFHLLGLYGESAFVYLLRCLTEEIDFRDPKLQKDQLKVQLLGQEFTKLMGLTNYATILCDVLGTATLPAQEDFLNAFAKAVKATMAQQLSMGLALSQYADGQLHSDGLKFLKAKLSDLGVPPYNRPEGVASLPESLLHSLLFFLERREGLTKQRTALLKILHQLYPEDKAPLTMVPLLYGAELEHLPGDLNSRLTFDAERLREVPSPVQLGLRARDMELADLMQDLGYSCCATPKCLSEVLGEFKEIDVAAVGAAVGMMARTVSGLDDSLSLHGAFSMAVSGKYLEFDAKFDVDKEDSVKALTAWNIDAFVEAINERIPGLDWGKVFEQLDQPTLEVPLPQGFALIVSIHRRACRRPLNSSALLSEWRNLSAQMQLISHALADNKGDVDWSGGRRVEHVPESHLKPEMQCWLNLDLTAALLHLSACGFYDEAQRLFSAPQQRAPQLLLTALVQMKPAGSVNETQLQADLLEQLLPLFISGDSAGSSALLQRLWTLQPAAVMRGMAQLHAAQPQSLLRLLDLAQSAGALEQVLRLNAFSFTLDLATVAQRKDLINFEAWLQQALKADGPDRHFVTACIDYLREKLLGGATRGGGSASVSVLSVDAAAVFFRIISQSDLPELLAREVSELYAQCVLAKPKLQALFSPSAADAAKPALSQSAAVTAAEAESESSPAETPSSVAETAVSAPLMTQQSSSEGPMSATPATATESVASATGAADMQFSAEVEEEANSYFQKIYNDAISIDKVVAMLKRFQASSSTHEHQVYACMVHNLFDEYRYFPKYPDKPLRTTALLFGALVQHGLVLSNMMLGMFLRYVLEALRKPPSSKMCKFALTALDQFKSRLPEWRQYCSHIYQVPHLAQVAPELIPFLESVMNGRAAVDASQPPGIIAQQPPTQLDAPKLPVGLGTSAASGVGGGPPGALFSNVPTPEEPVLASTGGSVEGDSSCSGSSGAVGAIGGGAGLNASKMPPHADLPGLQASSLPSSMPPSFAPGLNPALASEQPAQQAPQSKSPSVIPASATMPAAVLRSSPPLLPTAAQAGPPKGSVAPAASAFGPTSAPGSELPAAAMAAAFAGSGFGTQPCIETLISAASNTEAIVPPESVQDKIGFVLNNMTMQNVAAKSHELLSNIEGNQGYIVWFAQYLVVKRVSLEPNFHSLYGGMLDALQMKPLQRAILNSTLQNARVLLSSNKIRSSSSQRSLLKNLGSWLGQITLARNKALLMRDLDMKELICDAYERGLLIAVVPFVAKVLDACSHSRVFTPPNPWVMALMSLLLELYQVPDLKLNLKFEIEVLAKTLKVELADIKPSNKLASRSQDRLQTCDFANRAGVAAANLGGPGIGGTGFGQLASGLGLGMTGAENSGSAPAIAQLSSCLSGDLSTLTADGLGMRQTSFGQYGQPPPPPLPPGQPGQSGYGGQDKSAAILALAQQQAQQQAHQQAQAAAQAAVQAAAQHQAQHQSSQLPGMSGLQSGLNQDRSSGMGDGGLQEQTVIPNLSSYILINSNLQLFSQQPHLKRLVPIAIDRAIREIISPVVERSVTISCVTTRELMLKDFAMEPDELRMRKAAQQMVQNLAGSLALVTCKEMLRVACSNHLRQLLQQAGVDHQLMEQVVQTCSSENLDLGCTLIEKAATEKAVRDVEEALAPAFAIRRKHREQTGLPYYDMSIFTSGRYPGSLPEALRPKPGGLLPAQRRVYDDFGRIPRVATSAGQVAGPQGSAPPPPPQQHQPGAFGNPSGGGGLLGGNMLLPGQQHAGADSLGFGRGSASASPMRTASSGPDGQLPYHGSIPGLGGQMPSALGGAGSMLGVQAGGAHPAQQSVGLAPGETFSMPQALEKLSIVTTKLDILALQLSVQGITNINSLPPEHEVLQLLRQVTIITSCCSSRDESALQMVQKIFKRMFDQVPTGNPVSRLHTQLNVRIISHIHAACKKVSRFVTDMAIYSDEERKFSAEGIFALIGAGMLHMAEFGAHLAKLVEARNAAATQFSVRLVRVCLLEDHSVSGADCAELLAALSKLCQLPSPPEAILRLLDDVRASLASGGQPHGAAVKKVASKPPEVEAELDPALARVREQIMPLWEEWLVLYEQANASDKAHASFLNSLLSAGWLRFNESSNRFFAVVVELAIRASASSDSDSLNGKAPLNFLPLDALSKLVLLMIKFVPGDAGPGGLSSSDMAKPKAQLLLLTRLLASTISVLLRQYEQRPHEFNQRAYLRLFGSWLFDLNAPDPTLDPIQPQVLSAFCSAFQALQPSRLPGFAFGWMELISHRMFMPKLLLAKGQKGWPMLQRLLVGLFNFLHPYLSAAELTAPMRILYRGALRVLLVLLHDFPEFLCDYHFCLCDVIPPSCIQMRNLILSAFPRNMRLPDPFTPNLKVDLLPEISQPPRILSNFSAALKSHGLTHELDVFLQTRAPFSLVHELRKRIMATEGQAQISLMNSLVLHVGSHGIATLQSSPQGVGGLAHSAPMDIFQQLTNDLHAEGRYLFLNAIANQLRYPNNHTHYFSCVLLYLFFESHDENVEEQITRVLVERLIVHRPHPWGLLVTFIELIKNPRYNFWSKGFTRCAPEIERLFESVARSCMAPGSSSAAPPEMNPAAAGIASS
ncbi:hypothetical protein AB1Y20_001101 [Prymnesium parvum]|uniref:CCR4-NOT transcription complex subunit 1 n=1 Tax=Prymnesium parvum TaxID=97485 RepID=A0AB34KCL7_PRYPA|mmetsp:Transcript_23674/g.54209  ORF Transcript_23674/g.54209 Transcript_23674/m.54209 type:complete len:2636 (-) Transcript_23674:627-8534(-)